MQWILHHYKQLSMCNFQIWDHEKPSFLRVWSFAIEALLNQNIAEKTICFDAGLEYRLKSNGGENCTLKVDT